MKQENNKKIFKSIRAFECRQIRFIDTNNEDLKLYLKTAQLKKEIGSIGDNEYETYVLHNVTCTPVAEDGIKFIFINTYIKEDSDKGVDLYEKGKEYFNEFGKLLLENVSSKTENALNLKLDIIDLDLKEVSALDDCIIYDPYALKNILDKLNTKIEISKDDNKSVKGENIN